MYPNQDAWEQDFKKLDSLTEKVEAFRSKLAESASTLKKAYDTETELSMLLENLYSYAHHRSDEDTRDSTNLGYMSRIGSKATEISARLSWMDPELLETPVEKLKLLQNDSRIGFWQKRREKFGSGEAGDKASPCWKQGESSRIQSLRCH